MLIKNLLTGMVWDVTNPDRIAELSTDKGYEIVKKPAENKPEKKPTK